MIRKILDSLDINVLTEREKEILIINEAIEYLFNFLEPMNKIKMDCFNSSDYISYFHNLNFMDGNIANPNDITSMFSNLVFENEIRTQIDITKVDSVSASKSAANRSYPDMYSFGKDVYEIRGNKWSLEECLKDFNSKPDQTFKYSKNCRNNRIIWNNYDGSHHLAVAIYHLMNMNTPYLVNAVLCERNIDNKVATLICENYEVFITYKDSHLNIIFKALKELEYGIFSFDSNGSNKNCCLIINKNSSNMILDILKKFDKDYILHLNPMLKQYINTAAII